MVSAPFRGSQAADSQPGPSSSPMLAINNAKPQTTRARAPWPLDTLWSSSSKRSSSSKSRSPVSPALGHSYDSATGLDAHQHNDFADLPLTPPDSGASAFELRASAHPSLASLQPEAVLMSTSAAAVPPRTPVLLSDDLAQSPQKARSKNDIFNSPVTWLTPPSRPNVSLAAGSQTASPPPSRNSLFFSSFGSSSPRPPSPPSPLPSSSRRSPVKSSSASSDCDPLPPVPRAPLQHAPPEMQKATGRKKGHTRNSSLGRASSEECLEEEARIRATKHVDFRLCPTSDFLLGEGRHCSVYLGSYRPRPEAAAPPTIQQSASTSAWRLCAVKRLHADRQSQLLGLEEAFALRRLGTHPNIIQLIDIRDEVEFTASPRHTPQPLPDPSRAPRPASNNIGLGLPKLEHRGPSPADGANGHSNHSRSTSDMTGRDELLSETQSLKRALAYEKQHEALLARGILHEADPSPLSSQKTRVRVSTAEIPRTANLPTPTFLVQGPDGDDLNNRHIRSQAGTDTNLRKTPANTIDPPRLLMLLELLPNNLALYARKHTQRIDLQQWFEWALQMAEAVVFLHSKGCVHADIKKENMLLTEDLDIKLCDFNSAVFPNPSDPPRDGLGLGTPAYCAPELSRATGGPGATSFSYPIDIFSLGAVLYSLATGYEPFSKARSVVEMLHRKRLFFESEENDRASRLAVEAGSNPNSQPASRSGSLRGRHSKSSSSTYNDAPFAGPASPGSLTSSLNRYLQRSSPTQTRRDASNDSLESVASTITTISGRSPSSLAVARLLEPTDEPRGLLVDPNGPSRSGSLLRDLSRSSAVRRTASTGGRKAMAAGITDLQRLRANGEIGVDQSNSGSAPTSAVVPDLTSILKPTPAVSKVTLLELASRPDWLRRRSSYGDELKSTSSTIAYPSSAAPISEHTIDGSRSIDEGLSTTPTKPSRLRTMFSHTSTGASQVSSSTEGSSASSPLEQTRWHESSGKSGADTQAYEDGHPAIILPGGGRLPDRTRDLLRSMLQADPSARPTAEQVRQRLQAYIQQL
ncbi:likely protein kinase [Pseudozyma hubeiensis SY62]|uniref:Likely protein kinase n=1 Tax=Pseudozyma hubeiensis (strain SY62) TaxID=1305764 RepID=R9P9V0_PSEHS|nr:likely protein kinase [Pseudozyma hubeiensis SY62]GAC98134.1 likely protein kinase [Pseudozyma hubeiensis SY62]